MGALPAVGGFIVLSILFSFLSPFFLTERNFANLLTQAATLVMLGMALVFVILLGEIDLSAGVTAGVAMAIFVVLVHTSHVNWILALRRRRSPSASPSARSSASSWRGSASRRSS